MAGYFNFNSAANYKRRTATRTAGFWPYVVKAGILGWGIPVAILVTAMDWYQGAPLSDLGIPLAIRLVLFGIIGGIGFGAAMWKYSEYVYGKAAEKQAANQQVS